MVVGCGLCYDRAVSDFKAHGWVIWGEVRKIYLGSMFKVHIFADMNKINNKVSLREYATKHNPVKNRRGQTMSEGYLYRLIREDIKGINSRDLWFKYELTGEKDRIYIHLS